jgi:ribosome-binding ATPase YchF (GTP1/OBG family)
MTTGRLPSVEGGIQPTIVDAKGDLIVATAADTVSKLSVGANNTVLTADSSTATGLKWAAASSGGKFLSISETTYSTQTTIASTTFTDTGLTASITPSSATSKVWVICQQYSTTNRASSTNNGSWRLFRDATVINTIDEFNSSSFAGVTNFVNQEVVTVMYLDSPATTSSITYKTQAKAGTTLNSGSVIYQEGGGNNFSKMWLIEIGA